MTAHTKMARLMREVERRSSGRIIITQAPPRRLIIFLCRRIICFQN
jgi:hypothetical protein